MIDMVSIANFYTAPITTPFLALVLRCYIFGRVLTINPLFASTASLCFGSHFIGVGFLPRADVLDYVFSIGLVPCALFLGVKFSIGNIPRVFGLGFTIWVGNLPRATTLDCARFADITQAIGITLMAMEIFSRSRELLTAFCTAFNRGIHSVSLSLSRRLARQAVRVTALSGATLDAVNNYTRMKVYSQGELR